MSFKKYISKVKHRLHEDSVPASIGFSTGLALSIIFIGGIVSVLLDIEKEHVSE